MAMAAKRSHEDASGLSLCPFETDMLGIPTASLDAACALASGPLETTLEMARREGIKLVTCRCPASDRGAINALQDCGFRVIECLLTLGRRLDVPAERPARVRLARREDAEAVAQIGASTFRFDRFHADARVSDQAADRLKGAWARNAVEGRADAVFVAEDDGRIAGFNACLLREDAVIDLIGVAKDMQGKGIGRDLVRTSLSYYAGKAARMIVGTQSANHASLALYQSAGFRVDNSAFTLHLHLN